MQSPSSIHFPRSPSKKVSKQVSKQDFETFRKQQKVDKSYNHPTNGQTSTSNSGVTTSFLYKLSEMAFYTSAAISDAYTTLTAGGTPESESSTRRRREYNNSYDGDVMQINADDSDGAYDNDEMSDIETGYNSESVNKKMNKKDEVKWTTVNDEEEPPPPYDNSWAMPRTSSEASNSTNASMSSSPKQTVEGKSTSASPKDTNSQTIPRRRQIRVRRPRTRLVRRKSTEASTPRGGGGKYDDPDELLLKVNDKLSDMIAQGRAALTSTVDITEVDVLLAEEREREERILKELGLQTPVGRKGRKNTDYEYFGSLSDGNYSSPESSYCEYGYGAYNGHGSGFASPSGYATPDPYPSHGHYNTPSQFGSPGVYHQAQGGFNFSNLGFSMNNNNGGKFSGESDFNSIPNRYYPSSGFSDPTIPKGFGSGPISGGFGGPARFGRYGPNSGVFGANYGPSFGSSSVSGFGSNGFGQNGGYGTSGMYNNHREFAY